MIDFEINLSIFNKFDSLNGLYNNIRFISGTEYNVLKNYDKIIQTYKEEQLQTCVLIHCNDQVIATKHFYNLCSRFRNDLLENPNFKIIFISMYDYHRFYSLPTDLQNFVWIYYPEYQGIYWKIYQDVKPIEKTEEIEYIFLSMNKRADMYRQTLAYKFHDKNWIDTSIFTYLAENQEYTKLFDNESYQTIEKMIVENNLYSNIPKNTVMPSVKNDIILDKYEIEKRKTGNNNLSWNINREWYSNTYCSLVLETDVSDNTVNLSEKTFRSIMMQHPLYLFAAEHTYDYLNSIGLELLFENQLWNKGTVFSRFKIFLDYLDILNDRIKSNPKQLREETHEQTVRLRNQYYKLYQKMIKKEFIIQNLILNRFTFLKDYFYG